MTAKNIVIPENIEALIFDCDGTLVDSMPLHLNAWQIAVEKFGGKWNYDHFSDSRGMKGPDIIAAYNKKFGADLDAEAVLQIKNAFLKEHLKTIKPIQAVVDVAIEYKGRLPMAVVSGGSKENVYAELEVTGIIDLFDYFLTSDNDIKPKPAPDLFLYVAKLMNVQPEHCIVFEDGDLGLHAAELAGMVTVDVREYI